MHKDAYWGFLNVLITGGAGFIGSYISKRLLELQCNRVVILSRDWHKQLTLRNELGDPPNFRWFIGDIRDKERLVRAFNGIDYIIHTAAIKDIVSSAYSPREALLTNCIGTQNVIEAAIDCGIKKVLFISSDKAASASTTYGKSKAFAESLIIAANSYSPNRTYFSAVRYGNVLGSSDSVIQIFLKQRDSGKITVTHPKMSRFWITPNQAIELILRSLIEMRGGEIFVPHLPAASVMQIASTIAPHAEIELIGIRPGEKMHEIMIMPEETIRTKDYGWAYRILPEFNFWGATFPSGSPVPNEWIYSSASAPRIAGSDIEVILP